MEITLLRHATLLVRPNGKTLLVNSMFDPGSVEAILVTPKHADHLDETAVEKPPKDRSLFCQAEDKGLLRPSGFSDARPVGACRGTG